MEEIKTILSNFHFTNEVWAIMLPIILMGIDVLTGLVNAWIKKEVLSSKLRKGLGKKLGEISAILIGEILVIALDLPSGVADGVAFYIIVMELISICENLEKLGVPIPKFVRQALAITNENIQNGSEESNGEEEHDDCEEKE